MKINDGEKMKSLYDMNYEQMQEFALEQGWKKPQIKNQLLM